MQENSSSPPNNVESHFSTGILAGMRIISYFCTWIQRLLNYHKQQKLTKYKLLIHRYFQISILRLAIWWFPILWLRWNIDTVSSVQAKIWRNNFRKQLIGLPHHHPISETTGIYDFMVVQYLKELAVSYMAAQVVFIQHSRHAIIRYTLLRFLLRYYFEIICYLNDKKNIIMSFKAEKLCYLCARDDVNGDNLQ